MHRYDYESKENQNRFFRSAEERRLRDAQRHHRENYMPYQSRRTSEEPYPHFDDRQALFDRSTDLRGHNPRNGRRYTNGLTSYPRNDSRDAYDQDFLNYDNEDQTAYSTQPTGESHMNSYTGAGNQVPNYSGTQNRTRRSLATENFRGRGPKSYRRSDNRIKEDVCEHLTDDHEVNASDINVSVKEAKVTLSGEVSDKWMKYCAEDIAENIRGVKEVENKISVKSDRSTNTPVTSTQMKKNEPSHALDSEDSHH